MKLEIHNLSLDDSNNFNLYARDNEVVGLIGEQGSRILRIVGFLEPSETGEVFYEGEEVRDKKEIRNLWAQDISYIGENYGLVDNRNVYDNLSIVKRANKIRITEVLKDLEIFELMKKKVGQLSNDEKISVLKAKLVLKEPGLVLLDNIESLDLVLIALKGAIEDCTLIAAFNDEMYSQYCDTVIRV